MTGQKTGHSLMLVALLASALLCAAAAGRREPGGDGERGRGPAPVVIVHEGPPPGGDQRPGDQVDLMTLLAGQRGARVFDPDGLAVFDPGGWGIAGPEGWGRHGDQPGRPGEGRQEGPGRAPEGRRGDDIFGPDGWGILPLLAGDEAKIEVKSDEGVVSVSITGKGRRAVETIQDVIRAGPRGIRLEVGRGGRPDERGRDTVGPATVEALRDGVVVQMEVPHPGAEKMKDAVHLQVKAVEKLAEGLAGAMAMNRALRSGRVQTHWERHSKGAALVFTGPKELQDAAGKLESFTNYLDGKTDDIREARRLTADYFRPARPEPPGPPRMPERERR
jgi:hypothetical protein